MEQMQHALEKVLDLQTGKPRRYSLDTSSKFEPKQTEQPRRKLPPLVIPKEHPSVIMQRLLTLQHIEDIAKLLEKFQKQSASWEVWRIANWPENLGKLWAEVMRECRKNGFINPFVIDGKIRFSQILANRKSETDQCTLCTKRHDKGECKGIRNGKGDFVPCWKMKELN